MVNTIISWVVFSGIIAYLLIVFGFILIKNRTWEERVKFIKSFKFGKWSALFVICIPLFVIGYISNGNAIADSIFRAFTSTFKLITLSFDFTFKLTETEIAFKFALYCCYVAVLINDILIATSIFVQALVNYVWSKRFAHCKKEKCLIIGNNLNNLKIYSSCKHKKIIIDILNNETKNDLFSKKIVYHSEKNDKKLLDYIQKEVIRFGKKAKKIKDIQTKNNINQNLPRFRIVVNTNDDVRNIELSNKISLMFDCISKNANDETPNLYNFSMNFTDVYVFGDKENQNNYQKYEHISKGVIHYVNKYEQIAQDFVTKYPLSKFLNKNLIDYETSLLKPDTKINVSMVGFGKTNQELLVTLLSTCQFMSGTLDNYSLFDVNYHIFDRSRTHINKSFSSYALRYRYEFMDKDRPINKSDYLEMPSIPFLNNVEKRLHEININDFKFYRTLKDSLCVDNKNEQKHSINYVIVSLGNDYETIDTTSKIIEKILQWGIEDNTYVFACIDSDVTFKNSGLYNFGTYKNMIVFGNEKENVYNYDSIVNDFYSRLAIKQDRVYKDCFNQNIMKVSKIATIQDQHLSDWNFRSIYDKKSSLFAVLSLQHKLHLMGKELVHKTSKDLENDNLNDEKAFKAVLESYWKDYGKDDIPKYSLNDNSLSIQYPLDPKDFKLNTRRGVLSCLEHERWNHYTLTEGFVPLSFEGMKANKSQKNMETRCHGCLTTHDGLIKLRKFLLETKDENGKKLFWHDKYTSEYIKYDYQILDYLPVLLNKEEYKIQNLVK